MKVGDEFNDVDLLRLGKETRIGEDEIRWLRYIEIPDRTPKFLGTVPMSNRTAKILFLKSMFIIVVYTHDESCFIVEGRLLS
jgi:hypothetical protein